MIMLLKEMELTYVYNPYDVRIDNTKLLESLGEPISSIIMERGIISSFYVIDPDSISDEDYKTIRDTSLDRICISCRSHSKPSVEKYVSNRKNVKFVTSKILGVSVTGVSYTLFGTNNGYISSYYPYNDEGPIYASSREEALNIIVQCDMSGKEPIVSNHIHSHHSMIECAIADMSQNQRYDLVTKDKITYIVGNISNSDDREDLETIKSMVKVFHREGVICLPRINEDPRVEIFEEIAKQWSLDIDTVERDGYKSISISNNDSEIPGHIWFEESASRIVSGKIPLYHMHIPPPMTPEQMIMSKFAAISSYSILCSEYKDLCRHIQDVDVKTDGSVIVPVCNRKQINIFKKKMKEYIKTEPRYSIKIFKDIGDAILSRWYFSRMGLNTLMMTFDDEHIVVGLFERAFPTRKDSALLYDSLWKEFGKPSDLINSIVSSSDYLSLTGITNLGPITGMMKVHPKTIISVVHGSIQSVKFEAENEDVSNYVSSVIGNVESFVAKYPDIEGETSKTILTVANPKKDLINSVRKLWSQGFFFNDWARQYYIDNKVISSSFLENRDFYSEGIHNSDKIHSILS